MRLFRTVLLGATLVLLSSYAFADTVAVEEFITGKPTLVVLKPAEYAKGFVDPRVMVRRLRRGSTPFWGLNFSFDLSGGTGQADFFNAGPATLYGLTLTITADLAPSNAPEVFSCGMGSELNGLIPFASCWFIQTGGPQSVVRFYGGGGLPSQSHFSIELDGFNSNVQVSAVGSPSAVPEPGTLVLVLGGATLLLDRCRASKRRSA